MIVGATLDGLTQDTIRPLYVLAWGGVGLVWGIVLLSALYALIPRRTRRVFRQQRAFIAPAEFRWSEAGASIKQGVSVSTFEWSELHDWLETGEVFGFAIHERLYTYAPKRVMRSDEIDDLRRTVRTYAPRASKISSGAEPR